MNTNGKVIATAGVISVGVGSANAILKHKRPPSWKFLMGSAAAFFLLSAMSNLGEATGEVAKGLSLGVMTTVLLGEGGGLFSYIAGAEADTTKREILHDSSVDPENRRRIVRTMVVNPRGGFRSDTVAPVPGVTPTSNR